MKTIAACSLFAAFLGCSLTACGDDTAAGGAGGTGNGSGNGSGTSSSPDQTGNGSTGTEAPGSSGTTGTMTGSGSSGTGTGSAAVTGSSGTESTGTEGDTSGSLNPVSGTDASVTADVAGNTGAKNAVAVGMSPFVRSVPCGGLTPAATLHATAQGFEQRVTTMRSGDVLKFSPDGDYDMHSVRGDFVTPLGDETCLLIDRPINLVFDSSSHPEWLGIIEVR